MPPLSQLRSPSLKDLYEQLRFAPKAALTRDIERAESLAGEIDTAQEYPEDWIVFRVTGYRPELDQPALVSGEDLLWDLSALVERLSHDAGTTRADLAADSFIDANSLCQRWGVSRKTVDRFRKHGLIARRAVSSEGQSVLMFSMAAVEAFEVTGNHSIARAASFSRISGSDARRMHRRAQRYHTSLGYSLNEASLHIARRFGRSHEGVRQLLLRLDKASSDPVFESRPPDMDRRKAFVLRASRLGIEPAEIAARIGVARASVSRTLVEARADVLRSYALADPIEDESTQDDPTDHETGEGGLIYPHDTDLAALIAFARALPPPRVSDETHLAQHRLMNNRAASRLVRDLPNANVSATSVDRAETFLRRESRDRQRLVRMQLASVVRTMEDGLGVSVDQVNANELAQLLAMCIGAAADAAGRFDPSKGSRLAAPVSLVVSRVVAAWDRSGARTSYAGRATPLLRRGHLIADWTQSVSPWQAHLEPDSRIHRYLSTVQEPMRSVLALHFGLGCAPCTTAQTASALDLAPPRVAPILRRGMRDALDASRRALPH